MPAATDAHVTAAGSLAPGQWLGRYQLVRRIGVGGMAELYLARAPTGIAGLSRLVALKRILPQLSADDEFVDMFESEARLSALLRHPNIATLHEFVHLGDELFFTMEYVHGADLRAVLRRAASAGRGFRLSHALSIVTRAAAGLHHAHQQRSAAGEDLAIVHRDVSPTNIVVAYDGSVKVIDFGIAKALTRRTSTRTGHVRGKVGYLSPEQAIGAPLDRRSDIFSLAVVLYELTTGRRMFKGKDDYAVVYQLAHGDLPRPSAARSDYDPQLERILMRALSRDRERRYDSAQAFQEALEDYARDHKLSLSSLGVARFMHGLYGDVPDPSHQPGAVNSSAAAASQDAAAERDATDSSLSRSLDRTAPRASRRRQLWALAAAAAAASIGVGAYRGRGKVDSSGTAAVARPAVTAATQAVAPLPTSVNNVPTAVPASLGDASLGDASLNDMSLYGVGTSLPIPPAPAVTVRRVRPRATSPQRARAGVASPTDRHRRGAVATPPAATGAASAPPVAAVPSAAVPSAAVPSAAVPSAAAASDDKSGGYWR